MTIHHGQPMKHSIPFLDHEGMRHRRPAFAAAVCATLVLVGCSADADGAEPEEAPAAEAATEAIPEPAAVAADLPEAPPFERVAGPLTAIMTTLLPHAMQAEMTDAERDARFEQMVRTSDELIAACMHEQGFEFIPHPDPHFVRERAVRDDIVWGSREFVLEFAFGVTNPPTVAEEVGNPVHPNEALLEAMSDAHREEWNRALHGDGAENPGCFMAGGAAWSPDAAPIPDEFAGLNREASELLGWLGNTHSFGGNPIEEEWSACMVDLGHEAFHNPTALRHSLEDEFDAGVADLEQFAAREFALAADSFRCEVEVDLRRRSQEWEHEQEAAFVEEHRAELEAWLLHVGAKDATD